MLVITCLLCGREHDESGPLYCKRCRKFAMPLPRCALCRQRPTHLVQATFAAIGACDEHVAEVKALVELSDVPTTTHYEPQEPF